MTFGGWDIRLLYALGVVPTDARLAFLHAWQALEGGTARNNPFNTTLRLPGSWNYNRAGVQNYVDALQGLSATLLTIRLDYYVGVRAALSAPHLSAVQIATRAASSLDKWGTGGAKVVRLLQQQSR